MEAMMSDLPSRKRMRLPHHDYSSAGDYFITICSQNRLALFANTYGNSIRINPAGQMLAACWSNIPEYFDGVTSQDFVVMPNHIHGILTLSEQCPHQLWDIVRRYKTFTTRQYITGVRHHGWATFPGRLWQSRFWDHVIRDEDDRLRIREYIQNNPAKWLEDTLYVP